MPLFILRQSRFIFIANISRNPSDNGVSHIGYAVSHLSHLPRPIRLKIALSRIPKYPLRNPSGGGTRLKWPAKKPPLVGGFLFTRKQAKSLACGGTKTPERCSVSRRNREAAASPRRATAIRDPEPSPIRPAKKYFFRERYFAFLKTKTPPYR